MWSTALRAVEHLLVGEDERDHRLDDRNGAYPDAGIVAALGRNLRLVALPVDRLNRCTDRGGRLERDPDHDRLAGRNATEDAASVVGQEGGASANGVGILFA